MALRLNKFLALHAGVSRREADRLIAAGRVLLNDTPVTALATQVDDHDVVALDGQFLKQAMALEYLIFNKPEDALVTRIDPQGRRTIYQILPERFSHLQPVGRLDRDSCGLLLLTNHGELTQRLLHPRFKIVKDYHIRTKQAVSEKQLEALNENVRFRDIQYNKALVQRLPRFKQHGLRFLLKEGKKRQIRRMCKSVGLEVVFLERVALGPIQLDTLPTGAYRLLSAEESHLLLKHCELPRQAVT